MNKKKLTAALAAFAMTVAASLSAFAATSTASPTKVNTSAVQDMTSEGTIAADGTVTLTKIKANDTAYAIPETIGGREVTTVAANAMTGCTSTKTIGVPKTVTTVEAGAFSVSSETKALRKVKFKGKKAPKISKNAFSGYSKSQKKRIKIYVPKKTSKAQFKKYKKMLKAAGIPAGNIKKAKSF